MTDRPCLCVHPVDPAVAARVTRLNPPWCPQHGGTGHWKVILA